MSGITKTTDLFIGKEASREFPVTVSTVMDSGDLVTQVSGEIVKATSSTTPVLLIGRTQKTITVADDDYADARSINISQPTEKNNWYKLDYTGGTPVVGVEYDLSNESTVNVAATSVLIVKCMQVINATEAYFLVKFNDAY